jgi:hypothetical protein
MFAHKTRAPVRIFPQNNPQSSYFWDILDIQTITLSGQKVSQPKAQYVKLLSRSLVTMRALRQS